MVSAGRRALCPAAALSVLPRLGPVGAAALDGAAALRGEQLDRPGLPVTAGARHLAEPGHYGAHVAVALRTGSPKLAPWPRGPVAEAVAAGLPAAGAGARAA